MTRHLKARLARLAAQQAEAPPYFAELPHETWEREDLLQDVTAEALRTWREPHRTSRPGADRPSSLRLGGRVERALRAGTVNPGDAWSPSMRGIIE